MATDTPETRPVPTVSGAEHAPVVSFDGVSAIGASHGSFTFGLVVGRPIPLSNGTIPMVMGTVAYIKCSEHGLRELRESIENALLLAAKTSGSAN